MAVSRDRLVNIISYRLLTKSEVIKFNSLWVIEKLSSVLTLIDIN